MCVCVLSLGFGFERLPDSDGELAVQSGILLHRDVGRSPVGGSGALCRPRGVVNNG